MGRTYHKDEWARRRTQALFRLFRAQAPPDFRARVLQQAQGQRFICAQCTLLASSSRPWQWGRFWPMESWRTRPRLMGLAAGLGGICVLILGLHLAWWPPQYRGNFPPAQGSVVAVAQPGETLPDPGTEHLSYSNETLLNTANGPARASDVGPQTPPPVLQRRTAGTTAPAGQAGMPPLVPPTPWAMDEMRSKGPQSQASRPGPRRALTGKTKRSKQSYGTGKRAPV